jgi:hypothetical protein
VGFVADCSSPSGCFLNLGIIEILLVSLSESDASAICECCVSELSADVIQLTLLCALRGVSIDRVNELVNPYMLVINLKL